jgi:hypothetical protein
MGILANLINENFSGSPFKSKLIEIDQRLTDLEFENSMLKKENQDLRTELAQLKSSAGSASQFQEGSGVLWKKHGDGKHETAPYCPKCSLPLSDYSGMQLCLKCNWQAPFRTFEVPRIFNDLFPQG